MQRARNTFSQSLALILFATIAFACSACSTVSPVKSDEDEPVKKRPYHHTGRLGA